ncbi:hypothetical protein EVA_22153 [gut metagenome]|uniref:Uncharacterized protein n=1 Tax=gut metagenome TaxID=749906 RepID=J9BQ83_9ZZZZ
MMLGFGCALIFPVGTYRTWRKVLPLPKITFGFEF